ncbi:MAG: adenylyltransferase/cytidyltransferase family protein [Candidatus Saliniplasma sp.]
MGKKTVMAAGTFDLIHLGHLHYLKRAKELGDELVVVVACDETVREKKHEPLMNDETRAELIGALKPVDEVVIGVEGDPYETVRKIDPDIIALGYDQWHREDKIKKELEMRGLKAEVVRLEHYNHDLDGTRKIIRKIIDWYGMKKELDKVETS